MSSGSYGIMLHSDSYSSVTIYYTPSKNEISLNDVSNDSGAVVSLTLKSDPQAKKEGFVAIHGNYISYYVNSSTISFFNYIGPSAQYDNVKKYAKVSQELMEEVYSDTIAVKSGVSLSKLGL